MWSQKSVEFLRRHWVPIVLSLAVGALCVAPHFFAVRALGSDDRGIPFLYSDDEDIYLSRMQEIVDGHRRVGSVFFYEYKDVRPVQPPYGEWIYVGLSRILRASLPDTLVVAKFLFPAILFLLVYAFAWRLLPAERSRLRQLGAIAAAIAIVPGLDILRARDVWQLLNGQDVGLHLSLWTRPVNPILGGIVVFSYLNALWEAFVRRSRWAVIAAGILLGASVFYFFCWGALISVTAIAGLCALIRKDWPRARMLASVVGISFAVSAGYWISGVQAIGGEAGRIVASRNGMLFTHAPLLNKTLIAGLFVFALASVFLIRRGTARRDLAREPWWFVSLSLLLGGFLALNQQVVTGREIWPFHFVQYTQPFAALATVVVAFHAFKRWPKIIVAACIALSVTTLFLAALASQTYRSVLPDFRARQQEAALYDWLNRNTAKDSVVLVIDENERMARQIPAFTSNNVYLVYWLIDGVPTDRILHNFFVFLRLNGVQPNDAEAYLRVHHSLVRGYFYEDWNQMFKTTPDAWSDEKAKELAAGYATFMRRPFAEQLKKYRLDYITNVGPLDSKLQAELPPLETVGSVGPVWVYRVRAL